MPRLPDVIFCPSKPIRQETFCPSQVLQTARYLTIVGYHFQHEKGGNWLAAFTATVTHCPGTVLVSITLIADCTSTSKRLASHRVIQTATPARRRGPPSSGSIAGHFAVFRCFCCLESRIDHQLIASIHRLLLSLLFNPCFSPATPCAIASLLLLFLPQHSTTQPPSLNFLPPPQFCRTLRPTAANKSQPSHCWPVPLFALSPA